MPHGAAGVGEIQRGRDNLHTDHVIVVGSRAGIQAAVGADSPDRTSGRACRLALSGLVLDVVRRDESPKRPARDIAQVPRRLPKRTRRCPVFALFCSGYKNRGICFCFEAYQCDCAARKFVDGVAHGNTAGSPANSGSLLPAKSTHQGSRMRVAGDAMSPAFCRCWVRSCSRLTPDQPGKPAD